MSEACQRAIALPIPSATSGWSGFRLVAAERVAVQGRRGISVMEKASFLMGATALCFGCSSTIAARVPLSAEKVAEINDTLDGRSAKLRLRDDPRETTSECESVRIDQTVAQVRGCVEERSDQVPAAALPTTVPTTALRTITVKDHGLGALEGLGTMFLIGVVFSGWLVSTTSEADARSQRFLSGFAIGGFVSGLVLGLPIGAAAGHTTKIEFDSPPVTPR